MKSLSYPFLTCLCIIPLTLALGCSASSDEHEEDPVAQGALENGAKGPLTAKDFSLVQGNVSGSASKMYNEIANLGPGESVYAGLSGGMVGFGPDAPLGGTYDDRTKVWGIQCTQAKCTLNAIVQTKDIATGFKTTVFGGGGVTLRGKLAKEILQTLKQSGRKETGGVSCQEAEPVTCKVDIKSDLAMITLLEQRGEELGMKIAKAFFPDL